jgi:hypothetical protein
MCIFEINARVGGDLAKDVPRARARALFEKLDCIATEGVGATSVGVGATDGTGTTEGASTRVGVGATDGTGTRVGAGTSVGAGTTDRTGTRVGADTTAGIGTTVDLGGVSVVGSVLALRHEITLEDAIGSHACSLA